MPGLLESIWRARSPGGRGSAVVSAARAEAVDRDRGRRLDLQRGLFERILRDHFKLLSLDGCGLAGKRSAIAARAARSCITFARRNERRSSIWIRRSIFDRPNAMVLDAVTVRIWNWWSRSFRRWRRDACAMLDQTATGMGGRLMRQRLLRPSLDRGGDRSAPGCGGRTVRETILRAELRKATRVRARYRAAAGEGNDRQRRSSRTAGARQVARADPATGGSHAAGVSSRFRRG